MTIILFRLTVLDNSTLSTRMATGITIGHIEQYRPENKVFSSYLERVEQFIANDIKSDRKATFLSLIGSQMYSLLKNLVSPTIPKDN